MITTIEKVGVDADDTLWDESSVFMALENAYVSIISKHVGANEARQDLRQIHTQFIESIGYGFEGYQRAMESYAAQIAPSNRQSDLIKAISEATARHVALPLKIKPGIEFSLRRLSSQFDLILISKGNQKKQRAKLVSSGLHEYFRGVKIVAEKNTKTYLSVFGELDATRPNAAMIGNSVPSDISPALAAGAYALHVPHHISNPLDEAHPPSDNPRYFQFGDFRGAADWLIARAKQADRG